MKTLLKGYKDFYQKYFIDDQKLYSQLEFGQNPKTLMLACSDSRVDPSIVTSAKPGDIFAIRNVANLVPPYVNNDGGLHGVSAALEFAVKVLQVENIIILGHSDCAGVAALINQEKVANTDFVGKWVDIGIDAKNKSKQIAINSDQTLQCICEKEVIKLSLNNLLTFPWIKSRVDEGKLNLYGWYFSVKSGKLRQAKINQDQFELI